MSRPFEKGELVVLKHAPFRDYGEVMFTQRCRGNYKTFLVCVMWKRENILKHVVHHRLKRVSPLVALAMQA